MFVTEGTQTDIGSHEVLHDSKSVQTTPPKTSDDGVQTEDYNFFNENCFLSDDAKVHYYTRLTTKCALLLSTFEFVMKPFCNGEKQAFYWRSFL